MKPRWGDLPMLPDTESGIAAIEREQITKPRPVEVEGSKLHQPSRLEPKAPQPLAPEHSSIDDLTLHTIKLVQYSRKLKTLLHSLHQHVDGQKSTETDGNQNFPPAPPIPELPESVMVHYTPKDFGNRESDFKCGKGNPLPELSFQTVRQILRKSVAAICAHAGFDTATDTVLETLTDIAHEHNLRICRLLRMTIDRYATTKNSGFIDVIEQVFHEASIGSITTIHHYYQARMVRYHRYLLQMCQQLMEEYERLRTPDIKALDDYKPFKAKDEPLSEIQFPINEDLEEIAVDEEHTPLQLEELQGALQTMETDQSSTLKDEETMKWPGLNIKKEGIESTPNLDPDDENVDVTDSPTPSIIVDSDIPQSIPSVGISDTSPGIECTRIAKPPKKKRKKV